MLRGVVPYCFAIEVSDSPTRTTWLVNVGRGVGVGRAKLGLGVGPGAPVGDGDVVPGVGEPGASNGRSPETASVAATRPTSTTPSAPVTQGEANGFWRTGPVGGVTGGRGFEGSMSASLTDRPEDR